MIDVKPNKAVRVVLITCCRKNEDFELLEFIYRDKLPEGEGDKQLHHMYVACLQYEEVYEIQERIMSPKNNKHIVAFSKVIDY